MSFSFTKLGVRNLVDGGVGVSVAASLMFTLSLEVIVRGNDFLVLPA